MVEKSLRLGRIKEVIEESLRFRVLVFRVNIVL